MNRKIFTVNRDEIIFDDGSELTYRHEKECCETNYPDFERIEELAKGYEFEMPMLFESCKYGFRFGDERQMFFVPCYSEQNGYYTEEIDIIFNGETVISNQRCKLEKDVTKWRDW